MSNLELSDLNYAEALRELARRSGGVVHDEDGLMLYTGVHGFPVLVNGVFRTDSRLPADQVLGRARTFFGRHERGFTINIRAHADADLRAVCDKAGLVVIGDAPGMVLDHRLPDATPPPGVTLRRVATQA